MWVLLYEVQVTMVGVMYVLHCWCGMLIISIYFCMSSKANKIVCISLLFDNSTSVSYMLGILGFTQYWDW